MSLVVLLTGATGFVGSALCRALAGADVSVQIAGRCRDSSSQLVSGHIRELDLLEPQKIADLDLRGVDIVCHLAARVHVMSDNNSGEALFHRMNSEATEALAHASARSGVQRFVFLSSIKVNGEQTSDHAFRADDAPTPQDAYARSKWCAEKALTEISRRTGMEVVVVRPPLVYGPGVGANFLKLMKIVRSGWPVPLGAVDNRRSLISLWNLVDFLRAAILPGRVGSGVWLVSDDQDVSVPSLMRGLARGMGVPARVWSVPVPVLARAASMMGREEQFRRLVESLRVDIAPTVKATGWRPPVLLDEGLRRTAQWYLAQVRA